MHKDLSSQLNDLVKEECFADANERCYEIICPKCKTLLTAKAGANTCPVCSEQIDLKLNINFR